MAPGEADAGLDALVIEPHGFEHVAWLVGVACARAPVAYTDESFGGEHERFRVKPRHGDIERVREHAVLVAVDRNIESGECSNRALPKQRAGLGALARALL